MGFAGEFFPGAVFGKVAHGNPLELVAGVTQVGLVVVGRIVVHKPNCFTELFTQPGHAVGDAQVTAGLLNYFGQVGPVVEGVEHGG